MEFKAQKSITQQNAHLNLRCWRREQTTSDSAIAKLTFHIKDDVIIILEDVVEGKKVKNQKTPENYQNILEYTYVSLALNNCFRALKGLKCMSRRQLLMPIADAGGCRCSKKLAVLIQMNMSNSTAESIQLPPYLGYLNFAMNIGILFSHIVSIVTMSRIMYFAIFNRKLLSGGGLCPSLCAFFLVHIVCASSNIPYHAYYIIRWSPQSKLHSTKYMHIQSWEAMKGEILSSHRAPGSDTNAGFHYNSYLYVVHHSKNVHLAPNLNTKPPVHSFLP
ncbi:hypothetical protein DdX_20234 [Ditylenchus destructor]|uniref:Uncharacterized protein n=1 Tax=Ditylenchus destructor TaxID=166010 RepID=A0AAD4QWD5_9BILA|nr:hypothetical protein DdX_20234 [Ditylenchus destructor]